MQRSARNFTRKSVPPRRWPSRLARWNASIATISCAPRSGHLPGPSRRCGCDCQTVVSGDALVVSVAAASIVAKVTRDRLMTRLGLAHPGYGFERHMGYSVPEHFAALARLGPTVHHRKSFAPVAAKLAALAGASDEVIAELLPL